MGLQYRADTFQIIKGNKGAKGVVFYENFTGLNDDMTFKAIMKGAVYGGSDSEYYLLDTCITEDFRLDGRNAISIECSDFLWDEKYPLHYALQNAFDGDPSTSYVENTEDDLMEITFQGCFDYKKIRIINGYAQNKNLYLSNNRVKKMNNYILSDNIMEEQLVTFNEEQTSVEVQDLYKGEKYNDTCIAELNVLSNKRGWLFGEIDE